MKTWRFAGLIVLLLVCTGSASGDSCRIQNYRSYAATPIYQPAAVVVVPATVFQYFPAFYAVVGTATVAPAGPPAAVTVEGPPAVPSDSPTAPAVSQTSLRGHVEVQREHCGACHTGAAAKKGVVLFDAAGNFAPNVAKTAIWEEISEGRMPPKGRILSADKATLAKWSLE